MKKSPSLLALALLLIAPAFVQAGTLGTSTTYLSNFANTLDAGSIASSDRYAAQSFVTGTDSRGYSLDFVKIKASISQTPAGNFQVFLYDDNGGNPGTNLGRLYGPNPSGDGVYTYDTNGIGLSPSTRYWIVANADQPMNGDNLYLWSASAQSTFTGTDGWSIDTDSRFSTNGGTSWAEYAYYLFLEINAHVKSHLKVAIVASDSICSLSEAQSKLQNTGRFSVVDTIDFSAGVPTLSQLHSYDSVLVWIDGGGDSAALGDVLADYVDSGGGVVVAVFADASIPITGRFASDDYYALEPNSQGGGADLTLGTLYEPSSPLLAGVISFDGGLSSYTSTGSPSANASRVADWSNGSPLIVRRTINGVRRADLGFYPPSTDCRSDLWIASTDGAKMMANALDFVGGTDCVPLPPNATAWWRADGNGNDSVGGNNGSLLGGVAFGQGEVGQGFSFDGVAAHVSVPGPVANFGTGDFTIDFWMQTSSSSGTREIINKRVCGDAPDAFEVRIGATILVELLRNNDGTGSNVTSTRSYNDGQFHHIAIVRSGNTLSIYGDGTLDNSITDPNVGATNINNNLPLGIGGGGCADPFNGDGTATFLGVLDEIEIFNRALAANEIAKLYRAGSNGKCDCTSPPANMISWWPGEDNGRDIQSGNSLTFFNGENYVDGKVGRAFDFNGSQAASPGLPANLNITGKHVTIDGWVNPHAFNSQGVFFGKNEYGQNDYALYMLSGQLAASIKTSDGTEYFLYAGFVPPVGEWTHIALTYDGETANLETIYINGAVAAQRSVSGNINGENVNFYIGGRLNGGELDINAAIDEVEVFDRTLTATEISNIFHAGSAGKCRSCVTAPGGMVSWWPGDGNTNDIQDGNNGTFNGTPAFAPAKVAQGFSLNGTDQYVEVPDSTNLSITGVFTIDAWINANDNTSEHAIVEKYDYPGLNGYFLRLLSNGTLGLGVCNGSGCAAVSGNAQVTTGTFHHVVGVYDGSNLRVYLDGVLDGTGDAGGISPTDGTNPLTIGARGGSPGNFFNGIIDEVEIFNTALSPSDIAAIYDAGSGGKCKPPGSAQRQLANISARADVGTGDNVAIAGFIIQTDPNTTRSAGRAVVPTKRVLIRGLGPSLTSLGGAALADPVLDLYNSQGNKIDHNDNWMEEPDGANNPTRTSNIQATGLAPGNPSEAALLEDLISNSAYTAILSDKTGGTGIGLAEVYDLEATTTTHLHNLSTRAFVSTGDNVLIGGLIVQGDATTRILLRAIGPSLAGSNISNPLPDPVMNLNDANGNLLESNNDWGNSPEAAAISASGLAPTNSKESAILFAPAPGPYTAIVRDRNGNSGIGMVEAYWLGP